MGRLTPHQVARRLVKPVECTSAAESQVYTEDKTRLSHVGVNRACSAQAFSASEFQPSAVSRQGVNTALLGISIGQMTARNSREELVAKCGFPSRAKIRHNDH